MMKSARIAIVVDHPQRDLAGALLIAHELCQRGHSCHLVSLNDQESEIMALRPDFVLLNYLREFNYPLATDLHRAGIHFGVLDTEGGVWETNDSYTELLWRDRNLLQRTNAVCMWGPRLAQHVVEEKYFHPAQVRITGCARFDYYHPHWKDILRPDRDAHFRILINTNFSVVNPRFTTPEKNARYCHQEYGWSWEQIRAVTGAETKAIDGVIEMARKLAGQLPDCRIVLRPHPFESPDVYVNALQGLGPVTINAEGPVQPQIAAADVVIQRSCTTAMESVAAGVPTLSPQWIPAPYLMPMAEAVSIPCYQFADLMDAIGMVRSGRYRPDDGFQITARQTVQDWFYRVDGLSHLRVCEAVEAALPAGRQLDEGLCARFLYGLESRERRRRTHAANLLRYHLKLAPNFCFHKLRPNPWKVWTRTAKRLELSEARNTLTRIQAEARKRGTVRKVNVSPSVRAGQYSNRYQGFALSMEAT